MKYVEFSKRSLIGKRVVLLKFLVQSWATFWDLLEIFLNVLKGFLNFC